MIEETFRPDLSTVSKDTFKMLNFIEILGEGTNILLGKCFVNAIYEIES
jgi:hypothetical protein